MATDLNMNPEPESTCRLRSETEAVLYHCSWCALKIGDYDALRKARFQVDKYDRIYCSKNCYANSMTHPSREYEARGGDY
jgi:hypothetical protein